jgi:DNA-binding IclR family transcriptional regulator
MDDPNIAPPRQVKGVQTSLRIVDALIERNRAGITELAKQLDLSKATVHTHLSTLAAANYVVKEDGQYRPSLRYLRLGDRIRESFDIYEHGRDTADRLANRSGEVIYHAVKEGLLVNLIYAVRGSDEAIQRVTPLGSTRHFHTTASGKSMMAYMDEDQIDEIIEAYGLPPKTEFTVTTRQSLLGELEDVRDMGYATNEQEQHIGAMTVATTVRDLSGDVAGTISISGPVTRFDSEYLDEAITLVKQAANNIEIEINNSE